MSEFKVIQINGKAESVELDMLNVRFFYDHADNPRGRLMLQDKSGKWFEPSRVKSFQLTYEAIEAVPITRIEIVTI